MVKRGFALVFAAFILLSIPLASADATGAFAVISKKGTNYLLNFLGPAGSIINGAICVSGGFVSCVEGMVSGEVTGAALDTAVSAVRVVAPDVVTAVTQVVSTYNDVNGMVKDGMEIVGDVNMNKDGSVASGKLQTADKSKELSLTNVKPERDEKTKITKYTLGKDGKFELKSKDGKVVASLKDVTGDVSADENGKIKSASLVTTKATTLTLPGHDALKLPEKTKVTVDENGNIHVDGAKDFYVGTNHVILDGTNANINLLKDGSGYSVTGSSDGKGFVFNDIRVDIGTRNGKPLGLAELIVHPDFYEKPVNVIMEKNNVRIYGYAADVYYNKNSYTQGFHSVVLIDETKNTLVTKGVEVYGTSVSCTIDFKEGNNFIKIPPNSKLSNMPEGNYNFVRLSGNAIVDNGQIMAGKGTSIQNDGSRPMRITETSIESFKDKEGSYTKIAGGVSNINVRAVSDDDFSSIVQDKGISPQIDEKVAALDEAMSISKAYSSADGDVVKLIQCERNFKKNMKKLGGQIIAGMVVSGITGFAGEGTSTTCNTMDVTNNPQVKKMNDAKKNIDIILKNSANFMKNGDAILLKGSEYSDVDIGYGKGVGYLQGYIDNAKARVKNGDNTALDELNTLKESMSTIKVEGVNLVYSRKDWTDAIDAGIKDINDFKQSQKIKEEEVARANIIENKEENKVQVLQQTGTTGFDTNKILNDYLASLKKNNPIINVEVESGQKFTFNQYTQREGDCYCTYTGVSARTTISTKVCIKFVVITPPNGGKPYGKPVIC